MILLDAKEWILWSVVAWEMVMEEESVL